MTDQDRCPGCHHRYHSRRCFAMDGMKQCQCPGSPSLESLNQAALGESIHKMFPDIYPDPDAGLAALREELRG